MPTDLLLLPAPRSVVRGAGTFSLADHFYVRVVGPRPGDLLAAGRAAQAGLAAATGRTWQVVAGGPSEGAVVNIAIDSSAARAQGYVLRIAADGVTIAGHDAAGAFYAAQTLTQIARQFPLALPCLAIEDWPDFPARGIMLDVSRDKVPTMATLYALVDQMAELKLNQLQLYTEHTFQYRAHPVVWAQASPITGDELLALDAYCRERFVELVPNQNSFGHFERWLKHPRYLHLAECPDGWDMPWGGRNNNPSVLCPSDPASLVLLEGMYDELLPHFASRLFNIGCDETWELGQGRTKADCEARGTERVYLDFLLEIHRRVAERGHTMMFWGDIIMHRPELIPELPKDIIALEWGYEADHPFDRDGAAFEGAGVPFYVCPGTSSWNTLCGRTDNAIGDLLNAAENGLKHGAIGYLITDWGDNGHHQYLPVSWLGFSVGAAYAWALAANRDLPVADALARHVFSDSANAAGKAAYDLGNAYKAVGTLRENASALVHILSKHASDDPEPMKGITIDGLDAAQTVIEGALDLLSRARMSRPDAALIADELRNNAALLRVACRIGRRRLDPATEDADAIAEERDRIAGEHQRLWLARNRPGGLQDSLRRLYELPIEGT